MKALCLADLHLHHLPNWRLEWCDSFVSKLLEDYKDSDLHLYLLGDVLEIRDKVDARVLNMLLRLIKNWRGGDVVWLSGQHDSFLPGKATLYEINGMKLYKGKVVVVDDDVVKHNGNYIVPFQRQEEDYIEKLKSVPDGSCVFTHILVKEVLENIGVKNSKIKLSAKDFKRFRITISGDIHAYVDYKKEKFHYVGAPSQRDWRDKKVEGKIGWFDNGHFERTDVEHPKHIEVEKAEDIPEKGKYIVKLPVGVTASGDNILDCFESAPAKVSHEQIKVNNSIEELVNDYMEKNPPPVEKREAREYVMEVMGK